MEYRNYVENSPKASVIGFGAWQLGNAVDWRAMTDREAIELLHKALEEGVNFFDTAPNYGYGKSEELLGKALAELVDRLRELPTNGQTLSQFALQYCLAYDAVATVIPGAISKEQLMMNIECLNYPMDQQTVRWLENFYEQEVAAKNLVL